MDDLCRECPELRTEIDRKVRALRDWSGMIRTRIEDAPGPGRTPELPTVAGYEVLGVLGGGGMGVVYRARHLALGRSVALKMMRSAFPHPGEVERLRTEAAAVARLQQPNIVQIYEVGETRGVPYLALELVEGGSLDARLKGTPVPPATAARVLLPLARAMHACHAAGIVHRDLKPGNVLLGGPAGTPLDECRPKVTDFGLAKLLDGDSGATRSGDVMGTPSYMAPEQAAGRTRDVGPATDTYALGVILYEMLTGRPPFVGVSVPEVLDQVRRQEPVAPRRLVPGVPRDLETLCLKCLAKEPAGRYPSALALADDLDRFLQGRPVAARPVGPASRAWRWGRRNPLVAGLLAVLALVTASGFGLVTWKWRAEVAARREAEAQRERVLAVARKKREFSRAMGDIAAADALWKPQLIAVHRIEQLKMATSDLVAYLGLPGDDPSLIRGQIRRSFHFIKKASELAMPAQALEALEEADRNLTRLGSDHPRGAVDPSLRGHLHAARAEVYDRLRRPAEAEAERLAAMRVYDEAIPALDGEELAEALAGRAALWMLRGKHRESGDDLGRAIRLAPRPEWRLIRAEALVGTKSHAEAVAEVEELMARPDPPPGDRIGSAQIYALAADLADGDSGLAGRYGRRCVEILRGAWRAGSNRDPAKFLKILRVIGGSKSLSARSDFRGFVAEVEKAAKKK